MEICVDDVAGALAAEAEGADRIELCVALSEGGITPSFGLIRTTLAHVRRVGVQVMIRPRGGNFVVAPAELEVMLADIAAVRAMPHAPDVAVGFVLGALTPTGMIDRPATTRLLAACGGAPATFHKAFDAIPDRAAALDTLCDLGMSRVLTSGGASTAAAGADELRALVRQADGRIGILAGGGVRAGNVRALLAQTGVKELHLRAMRPGAGGRPVTSAEDIAAFLRLARTPA